MARHRQAYLDLDTSIPQYVLSFSVVVSRRGSSATSQLAGLFAAAVRLRELSSSGAVVSGQESPRGSLLSTASNTPCCAALCIAHKSAAALPGPHGRSASKGWMHVCLFRPLDALPRLSDRCPLDLDSKERKKKKLLPARPPPWSVLVVSTRNGVWSILDVLRTRSNGPVSQPEPELLTGTSCAHDI